MLLSKKKTALNFDARSRAGSRGSESATASRDGEEEEGARCTYRGGRSRVENET